MSTVRIFGLLYLLFLPVHAVFAQKTIQGYIQNVETGENLPYANIQVKDTFRGTISNKDGKYVLKLNELPAILLVRYIGYKSKEVMITESTPNIFNISLEPTVIEFDEIVVTAEDPAVTIMREVIKRKQQWRKRLATYEADAYTRIKFENDTSIVLISESTSKLFWDVNKGPREIIKSKKETANIRSEDIFAASNYLPNFYNDDIEVQGTNVIGPTHPDALKYYKFKLVGQRSRDDKIVFDIHAEPKSKLQPTFVGRISVLDEVYAMIDVDLKPSQAVLMPFPIQDWDVDFNQQFSDFGQEVWLPVDVRMQSDIKISLPGLHFPVIKYSQLSRITNYEVNVDLPDSLYKDKKILIVDSLSIKQDTLLAAKTDIIPLTAREIEAYDNIDSTMTLEKAFQPTGFLAWLMKIQMETESENENNRKENQKKSANGKQKNGFRIDLPLSIRPQYRHNRVDHFHLGAKITTTFSRKVIFNFSAGYKTGLKRWAYGAGVHWNIGRRNRTMLQLSYLSDTQPRYHSENYPLFLNSTLNLLGMPDYYDYYWNKKYGVKLRQRINKLRTNVTIGVNSEDQSSVEKTNDTDLFGRDYIQRANPAIQEGKLRSVELNLNVGDDYIFWGFVGQKRAGLTIEYSHPDFFSSDFSFTRYQFSFDWRLVTYLKRRLLPNVLDLHVIAGTSTGDLPVQRFGILDVRRGAFSPFGVFKTLRYTPYEGERYFAVFWEHNFRTLPFELIGWQALVKRGIGIVVHGASGRTWISTKKMVRLTYSPQYLDEFHHEIGLSVNGIFGFLRLDATKAINKPGLYLGFGFARMF